MEPSYFFPLNSKSRDQITHLFFKNLQLNLIQNSFQNFQNLIHLDLSRNNLTQLPIQISNFFFSFLFSNQIANFFFFFFFETNRKSNTFNENQYFKQ